MRVKLRLQQLVRAGIVGMQAILGQRTPAGWIPPLSSSFEPYPEILLDFP